MKNLLAKLPIKKSFANRVKNTWGGVLLLIIIIAIGIINHKTGTILTGWDNLHPEFNLALNIKRSIFAVWQEYQSLGLLGGMGHASDLVRQVALLLASSIIPMELLRYSAMITSLAIGSIGMYALIKTFITPYLSTKKELLAFSGGLFYLLNIATIQTYFVAFEAFTSHYAALPWLFYGTLRFMQEKSLKSYLVFCTILLLATPAGYIPTLFVAFMIGITITLFGLFLLINNRIAFLKQALLTYITIILVNSFWLFPFIYFTLTNSGVNVNAKMNQMATEGIFLQNKEFGDLTDVIQLKGFWFNNVDPNLNGDFTYMLEPWRSYFANPFIALFAFLLFGIVLFGVIYAIKSRRPLHLAFLLLLLFTFTMLATNTPPFSWGVALFREVPLFSQAFRFPFTKFSILAAFSYSIFFSLGIYALFLSIKKYFSRALFLIPVSAAIITLLIPSFPVFTGHLFYEKEQITLPQEYYDTFDFFNSQNPNTRVATLPMHTFWGWNYYKWGYGGSGFLWYGIRQPIIDRAFDVWSTTSENSYFELSNALYAKDSERLRTVLEKYQITWLILDKNIYSPQAPRALFYNETEDVLSQIPSVSKAKTFGNIEIYKVDLKNKPQDFVLSAGRLPSTNPYIWNEWDQAIQNGFYSDQKPYSAWHPFRSLFTGKLQKDVTVDITESSNAFIFKNTIPQLTQKAVLNLPSLKEEKAIPIEVLFEKDAAQNAVISIRVILPEIRIDNTLIENRPALSYPLFVIPNASGEYSIDVNGTHLLFHSDSKDSQATMLSLTHDNYMSLIDSNNTLTNTQTIEKDFLLSLPELSQQEIEILPEYTGKTLTITLPKVIDNLNGYSLNPPQFSIIEDCNVFRNGITENKNNNATVSLSADNDSICASDFFPTLSHELGYIVTLNAKNNTGRPLHFWVLNTNQQYGVLDTHLNRSTTNYTFIVPPMEQFGQGYSFHFDSVSLVDKTENEIRHLGIYPVSFSFLNGIILTVDNEESPNSLTFESSHPNESLYVLENITVDNNSPATLILSQSFDPGWTAYAIDQEKAAIPSQVFPFLFGKKLSSHVTINNWENGWIIENPSSLQDKTLIIVYLPQYLEYIGFILLSPTFLFPVFFVKRSTITSPIKRTNVFFESKNTVLREKIAHLREK